MRENDFIVASLNNPTFTIGDFLNVLGMDLENTQFLTEEEYLKSPFITENDAFKDKNGNFDLDKFDKYYTAASQTFNQFATEDEIDNFEYSMWDVTAPADARIKYENFNIKQVKNPDHIDFGIAGTNEYSKPEKSRRELAQNNRIYDPETDTWSDKSVNDIALLKNPIEFFKSLTEEPLVYALYDEDTVEVDPWTGLEVQHHKGEWKTDEFGEYYTEKLGGRPLIDKQVVSAFDYLTPEDSTINKYDFFDSDDLEKSIGGSIMRTVAAIAPLFTPAGGFYTGLLVARELIKTLPMAYGMITGLLGSNNNNSKLANTWRAYGERLSFSSSDYAQLNVFSFENFANLATEVANQWSQLRLIAQAYAKLTGGIDKVSEAYKNAAFQYGQSSSIALDKLMRGQAGYKEVVQAIGTSNPMEIKTLIETNKWMNTPFGKAAIAKYVPKAEKIMLNRIKQGQDLSLAYMALVSNTDVYDTVKRKGGTGPEAAWITLGSTLGMFGVDKFLHLGEAFFSADEAKQAIRIAAKQSADEVFTGMTGLSRDLLLKQGLNIGQKAVKYFNELRLDFVNHTLGKNIRGFLGKSLGEGLEEVSEELMADASKQIGEIAGELGYASLTDYGAWENAFDRYVMNFLGGAMGGGIFYGVDVYQNRGRIAKQFDNDMIYLIRNGKKEDILSELAKLHDKGQLGSTKLSMRYNDNGTFLTAKDKNDTQNLVIYNLLVKHVNDLDAILNEEGLNLSDDELFFKMVQGEIKADRLNAFLGTIDGGKFKRGSYITRYYQDALNLSTNIVNKINELNDLENKYKDSEKSSNETYKREKKKLEDDLAQLRKDKDYLFGEGSIGYVEKTLFAIDGSLLGQFIDYNKPMISLTIMGKEYDTLTDAEKKTVDEMFNELSKTKKLGIDTAFRLYKLSQETLNPDILKFNDFKFSEDDIKKIEELSGNLNLLSFDSKLEGETDDLYEHRRTKYDNETDEDLQKRINERKEKIEKLNNDKIAENLKALGDMPADRSMLRLKHILIGLISKLYFEENIKKRIKALTYYLPGTDGQIADVQLKIQTIILNAGIDADLAKLKEDILKVLQEHFKTLNYTLFDGRILMTMEMDNFGEHLITILDVLNDLSDTKKQELGINGFKFDKSKGVITVGDIRNAVVALAHLNLETIPKKVQEFDEKAFTKNEGESDEDFNARKQQEQNRIKDDNTLLWLSMEDWFKKQNLAEGEEADDIASLLVDTDVTKRMEALAKNLEKLSLMLKKDKYVIVGINISLNGNSENITLQLYVAGNVPLNDNIDNSRFALSNEKINEETKELATRYFETGDEFNDRIKIDNITETEEDVVVTSVNADSANPYLENGVTYFNVTYLNLKYKVSKDRTKILDETGKEVNKETKDKINNALLLKYNDDWTNKKIKTIKADVDIDGHKLKFTLQDLTKHLYDDNGTDISTDPRFNRIPYIISNRIKRQKESDKFYSSEKALTTIYNGFKKDKVLAALRSIEKHVDSAALISPILAKIRKEIRGTDETISLEEILGQIYELYRNGNPAEFLLSESQILVLLDLQLDILFAEAFVHAASDETSFERPVGHNKMLNRYAEKHKDIYKNYKPLPEIEARKAQYIIHDANTYLGEINEIINLHNRNMGKKQVVLLNAGRALDKVHLDFFKNNKDAFIINGVNLLDGIEDIVDNPNPDAPYLDLIKIEETIRYNFHKNNLKLSDVLDAFKDKLFKMSGLSTLKRANVDDKLEYKDMTDYDKFTYIITVLGSDNLALYQKIKEIVGSEDSAIMPISILEFAAKIGYVLEVDDAIVSEAIDWAVKEGKINKTKLYATIVEGTAGAGKTTVISKMQTVKAGTIWISGPTQFLIQGLKNNMPTAEEHSVDNILKIILGSEDEVAKFKADAENVSNKSNYFTLVKNELTGFMGVIIKDTVTLNKADKMPKYLIIDEAAHLNTATVALIDKWAHDNGVRLILVSDTDQNGNMDSSKKGNLYTINISYEGTFAWRTPALQVSLRDANVQKYNNQKGMLNLIHKNYDTHDEWTSLGRQWIVQKQLILQLLLHYYQDADNLFGDKVVSELTDEDINFVSKGTVAYIGNETDEIVAKLRKVVANVQVFSAKQVQGLEFDYVVIGDGLITFDGINDSDVAEGAKAVHNTLKNIYTLTSRARKAAIIIDSKNNILQYALNILDKITGDTSMQNAVQKFKEQGNDRIDKIVATINDYRKDHHVEVKESTDTNNTTDTDKGTSLSTLPTTTNTNTEGDEQTVTLFQAVRSNKYKTIKIVNNSNVDANVKEASSEAAVTDTIPDTVDGRCYVAGSHSGITINYEDKDDRGRVVWKNNTNTTWDLGIFLLNMKEVTDGEEKNKLVRLLLYLKSVILYDHIDEYDSLDNEFKQVISKSQLLNLKWYICVEEVNNNNCIVGSTLENDMRGIADTNSKVGTRYVITVAASFEKDGKTYYITMGDMADPVTWKNNANNIKDSIKKRIKALKADKNSDHNDEIKLLRNYISLLDNKIDKYAKDIQGLIDSYKKDKRKIRYEINKPKMQAFTSLIHTGNQRLENIYDDTVEKNQKKMSRWEVASRYAVVSEPFVLIEPKLLGLNLNLAGKCVIYVSNDLCLSLDQLPTIYALQKNNPTGNQPRVRLIVLSNVGVGFTSMISKNWKNFYSASYIDEKTEKEVTKMNVPYDPTAMGIRMFIAAWNFRADINNFKDKYDDFKNKYKLTDKDIQEICKKEREMFVKLRGNENFLSDLDFREKVLKSSTINQEDKDNFAKIWDFNDSLGDQKIRFRLGYEEKYGVYIGALHNLKKGCGYTKNKNGGYTANGIYITPLMMLSYHGLINGIFTNVFDKFIKVNADPKSRIKLDKTKTSDGKRKWYSDWSKNDSNISITTEEDGNPTTIKGYKKATAISSAFLAIGRILRYSAMQDYQGTSKRRTSIKINTDKENTVNVTLEDLIKSMVDVDQDGFDSSTESIPRPNNNGNFFGIVLLTPTEEGKGLPGEKIDLRTNVFFNLLFHGLVVFPNAANGQSTFNDFISLEQNGTLQATDAEFKYGMMADPRIYKKEEKGTANGNTAFSTPAIANKALLMSDVIPTMGHLLVDLSQKKQTKTTTKSKTTLTGLQINETVEKINMLLEIIGLELRKISNKTTVNTLIDNANKKAKKNIQNFFENIQTKSVKDISNVILSVQVDSDNLLYINRISNYKNGDIDFSSKNWNTATSNVNSDGSVTIAFSNDDKYIISYDKSSKRIYIKKTNSSVDMGQLLLQLTWTYSSLKIKINLFIDNIDDDYKDSIREILNDVIKQNTETQISNNTVDKLIDNILNLLNTFGILTEVNDFAEELKKLKSNDSCKL